MLKVRIDGWMSFGNIDSAAFGEFPDYDTSICMYFADANTIQARDGRGDIYGRAISLDDEQETVQVKLLC